MHLSRVERTGGGVQQQQQLKALYTRSRAVGTPAVRVGWGNFKSYGIYSAFAGGEVVRYLFVLPESGK